MAALPSPIIVGELFRRRVVFISMAISFLRVALITAAVSCLVACSTSEKRREPRRDVDYTTPEEPSELMAKPMPWEIWQPFQDLQGQPLRNRALILGDELQQRGRRRSALDSYLKASSQSLLPREAEAAALRVSSQYLALDQAKKSLSAIGAFFKRRGLSESNVEVPFGLMLAFAYGRTGDVEQSLAWFSKVNVQGRVGGPAVQVARTGTALFLRTLSPEEFERIADNWRADSFISEIAGQERLRRTSPGYVPSEYSKSKPFWLGFEEAKIREANLLSGAPQSAGATTVGLILSLSDRFGSLGRDTQRGFDLAVEANNQQEPKVKVEARDVGADMAASSAAVRELKANANVSVIAGPLLTEAAVSAAQTAREVGVPLLSFSKSETFATGNGIFRLGATTTSQIDALVNAAYGEYKINRFAIAYPTSASGAEFLEAFKKKLASLGLSLELEVSYVSGDETSMLEVAQQLEGSSAEAVLIADGIEASARLLSGFSPVLRKRMRPLGTALWDNAPKIARSQALFERAIFVTPFFTQSNRPEVQRFIESYRGKYQATPNFLAAQGFDAATLIMTALRQSVKEGSSFDKALSQLPPYTGVTGSISILPNGEIVRNFYIVEVMRDSFQEKMPNSSPPVYDKRLNGGQPGGANSQVPLLGDAEKVDSGY